MSHDSSSEEEYLYFSADHTTVADQLYAEIAGSPEQFIKARIQQEGVLHDGHLIEAVIEMAGEISEIEEERDVLFTGMVFALSVLDHVADRLEVGLQQYRRNWILLYYMQGQMHHLRNIDKEYERSRDYHLLVQKIADELAYNEDERELFVAGFSLLLCSGRDSIIRMKLVNAAEQADKIIENSDINSELGAILGRE